MDGSGWLQSRKWRHMIEDTTVTRLTSKQEVTPSNELPVDVDLGYCRPLAAESRTPQAKTRAVRFAVNPTSSLREERVTYENSLIPLLNSSSANTLYVCIFSGGTPWRSRTWTAALENPHCGASGVPFMNRTTGLDSIAFWIVARASVLRHRKAVS